MNIEFCKLVEMDVINISNPGQHFFKASEADLTFFSSQVLLETENVFSLSILF